MTEPLDKAARDAALDPARSFAVSAPAGSGKTGLLTQRVLKLLALCDYPEEVLAITFTRKAAQEMHHRITAALQAASREASPESPHDKLTRQLALQVLARDDEQGWKLLRSPNRLRIQTIDSFCQSLIRKLPLAAGASAYLDTRENASGLYRDAVRELFRELQNEGPLAEALATVLRHMDNNLGRVENLLMQLLEKRSQWLGPLYYSSGDKHYFEATVRTIIDDTLDASREKVGDCLGELRELLTFAVSNRLDQGEEFSFAIDEIDLNDREPGATNLAVWKVLVELCLTQKDDWRKAKGITARCGFPAPGSATGADKKRFAEMKNRMAALLEDLARRPGLLELLADVRALPDVQVDGQQWRLLESLTLVLPALAALFHLHCRQVGEADFSEVAIAASRALGEDENPSDLALQLDYRIKHILVDEFQDTSLPQLELLQKLTAGWQAGDGRTLFIVGDAMQSCYGFRDANVGIFIQARDRGIGTVDLTPLNLTVNFRSDGRLVDWVNRAFRGIFPPRDDINRGAVCYSEADPGTANQRGTVEAVGFLDCHENAQSAHLVQLVKDQLLASDSGSVAILARSRGHLQDILRELRLAGLQWQARDIDALGDRMAVIDLLSLTRALLNLSDRIAWLALLRSPWCGLDLHDLYKLANTPIVENPAAGARQWPSVWGQILHCEKLGLSEAALPRVQRLRKILRQALARKGRKPLRQWIEGVWLALGGVAAVANPAEVHSPRQFLDLLDQHAQGADIEDWEEFETALAGLYDKSDSSSRLQVMTIHKSKGLEFDTVIIPKLDKGTRGDDSPLLLWQEYTDRAGRAHLLISPLGAVGGEPDGLYTYLKRERALRQEYETARLLYVACTRAISRLYLLTDLQRDEKTGAIKRPGRNTLAGHLWPSIENDLTLVEEDGQSAAAVSHRQAHLLRLPAHWQAPAWPRDETLAAFRGRVVFEEDNRPDPAPLLNRRARYLGTVLHRALQRITEEGLDSWTEPRIEAQTPVWIQQLRQLGMTTTDAAEAGQRLADAVRTTLADPNGRWLLDHGHEDSQCELSLTAARAGYRESIVDRTFVDRGTRWIVDYKTSEPAAEQSLAEFLNQAELEYRDQLQRYGELLRDLDRARGRERPVKTALYFPLLKVFREIPLESTGIGERKEAKTPSSPVE